MCGLLGAILAGSLELREEPKNSGRSKALSHRKIDVYQSSRGVKGAHLGSHSLPGSHQYAPVLASFCSSAVPPRFSHLCGMRVTLAAQLLWMDLLSSLIGRASSEMGAGDCDRDGWIQAFGHHQN